MKKEFMALMSNGLVKKDGDYDSKFHVYYHKTDNGWGATDEFTGRLIVFDKKTKKECQESVANTIDQIDKIRNGENYLKGVINYREKLEE